MTVAVLCPGPSLWKFQDEPSCRFDKIIGVNRAACFTECDYWVFLDQRNMRPVVPMGDPEIVNGPNINAMLRVPRLEPGKEYEKTCPWRCYSSTSAIMVAARHLGARHIVCFGVDHAGSDEWDLDTSVPNNRSPERWAGEIPVWQRLKQALSDDGIILEW
jgi:hypothetical protein